MFQKVNLTLGQGIPFCTSLQFFKEYQDTFGYRDWTINTRLGKTWADADLSHTRLAATKCALKFLRFWMQVWY